MREIKEFLLIVFCYLAIMAYFVFLSCIYTGCTRESCSAFAVRCAADVIQVCGQDGEWLEMYDCGAAGAICTPHRYSDPSCERPEQ
jgi:hypothetical protein